MLRQIGYLLLPFGYLLLPFGFLILLVTILLNSDNFHHHKQNSYYRLSESLEHFVERTHICFTNQKINSTVENICKRILADEENFYTVSKKPVNIFNYDFIISAANVCNTNDDNLRMKSQNTDDVDFLIIVHSHPINIK